MQTQRLTDNKATGIKPLPSLVTSAVTLADELSKLPDTYAGPSGMGPRLKIIEQTLRDAARLIEQQNALLSEQSADILNYQQALIDLSTAAREAVEDKENIIQVLRAAQASNEETSRNLLESLLLKFKR